MAVLGILRAAARRCLSELQQRQALGRLDRQRRRVAAILARKDPPDCSAAEAAFDLLQAEYSGVPEYGYDTYSTWRRGTERALELMKKEELRGSGLYALDAGCGDGMTGYALAGYGYYVTLTDADDWRDARAKDLHFVSADLCEEIPLESNSFDVVFSYNTLEHVDNPKVTLRELIRLCKYGGLIYLDFGPLYAGPWGLHAYRTLRMPYPQFLFSGSFLEFKLQELGIHDLGEKRSSLQPLNEWRVSQFDCLWEDSRCEIVSLSKRTDYSQLNVIEKFPLAFAGRSLSLEDVTTQAICAVLKKIEN